MLEKLSAPDYIAAFRLSGTLTEDDVDQAVADIEARLERHRKIGIVADIAGLHDLSIRAAVKDLRYSFGKLFAWHRFPREAIVTDNRWLRRLAKVTSPLVPFVEVKTFDPDQVEAAIAWVGNGIPLETVDVT